MSTTTTTLTKKTKRPFYFRCTECGALNVAMYPIEVSTSYDNRNAGIRRSTINQNMKQRDDDARNRLDQAMSGKLYTVTHETLHKGWMGCVQAPGVCGKCGTRQAWNLPIAWWTPGMLLCIVGAIGAVILFGTRKTGGSYLPSIIAIAAAVLGFVVMKLANRAHVSKIDAVPEQNRPHVFATPETFVEALQKERKPDEPLYGEMAQNPAFTKK
ncbi:MAG: DUF456 domain-containing protein [Clostridia bacterium]|nr:DUF456 domain-containing protein [Clostridia bacterium]